MSKKRKKKFVATGGEPAIPGVSREQAVRKSDGEVAQPTRPSSLAKGGAIIVVLVGIITFATGLTGEFMSDDAAQITENPVMHSITNISHLFSGSTYFDGKELVGQFYRPLMAATFSLLYTLFGENPVPFHLLQLLMYVTAVIFLFKIFRFSFSPILALGLALIFLVHPINSQSVYSISALQDVLFLLFGLLSIWILLRYYSTKSMVMSALCLFMALLSKETGALFVIMSLVYLYLFDRRRLWPFLRILLIPIVCYIALKANAVGLVVHPEEGGINKLSLWERLLISPSIIWFFLRTLVWPGKLASGYYWTNHDFSFSHLWLPLFIDIAALGCAIYGALIVRRNLPRGDYLTYGFFASWAALGLALHIQLIPLEMTACTNWFLFAFVGLLGMIGEVIKATHWRFSKAVYLGPMILIMLVGPLGVASFLRGLDWRDRTVLAYRDIEADPSNAGAYLNLASENYRTGDYAKARDYAKMSARLNPGYAPYNNLGYSLIELGDYQGALDAFKHALDFYPYEDSYVGLASVASVYGDYATSYPLVSEGLKHYPQNAKIWTWLAVLELRHQNHSAAKAAINEAARFGQVSTETYNAIINEQTLKIKVGPTTLNLQ